jgi:hypothetical protein
VIKRGDSAYFMPWDIHLYDVELDVLFRINFSKKFQCDDVPRKGVIPRCLGGD